MCFFCRYVLYPNSDVLNSSRLVCNKIPGLYFWNSIKNHYELNQLISESHNIQSTNNKSNNVFILIVLILSVNNKFYFAINAYFTKFKYFVISHYVNFNKLLSIDSTYEMFYQVYLNFSSTI